MTVEQTAFPQYNQKQVKEDYAKIYEVTGISDTLQINKAIEACKNENGTYEIAEVISVLTGQNEGEQHKPKVEPAVSQKTKEVESLPFIGPRNRPEGSSSSKSDVVDLTVDNSGDHDEIQRAIAESLKDSTGILGGQVSREEQEISRLLEQSLEESKASSKRKRGGDIWFVDPLNPHERKRVEGWPVGLKNVGNTCWFSAVIQSLFHLPIFRRLVLKFSSPESPPPDTSLEARNFRFMRELRSIFALMVGTKRKYIDPSRAVEILKEAFSGSGSSDSQQDVSEFQHKLLEWLEDAFRRSPQQSSTQGAGSSHSSDQMSNPMVQLFYGQYRAEGTNEGKSFMNEETFGQFPLQVEGVQDIHASLEAAMAQGEIENLSSSSRHKSRQEQWFTRLPPVLTFELSRFQFNQALGRPEKIHNKLEFPELLFMDRYMEVNKRITQQKREEVKKLREELQQLHDKLDKFVHYGSGPKRVPLHDVLKYALEFAQTQRPGGPGVFLGTPPRSPLSPAPSTPQATTSSTSNLPPPDVDMESPKSHCSMAVDSPGSVTLSRLTEPPDLISNTQNRTVPANTELKPCPRQVTANELQVLQSCLKRWRTEVENDVRELQEQINRREEAVAQMYNDSNLHMYPYRLHAVLVHEGQAASGHYWAYVYCMQHRKWLKFNDITVSEASWEELQKESMGGYHNASAYCLMYLHATRTDVLTGDSVDGETGVSYDKGVGGLPSDLQKLVEEDNLKFTAEMEQWDHDQSLRAAKSTRSMGVGSGDATEHTSTGENQIAVSTQTVNPATSLLATHAQLAVKSTQNMLQKAAAVDGDVTKALQQAMSLELTQLNDGLRDLERGLPQKDPRLSDFLVYVVANEASRDTVIARAFLEKLTYLPSLEENPKYKEMRSLAAKELESMVAQWTRAEKLQYQKWHKDYESLRKCAYVFCLAMKAFTQERYTEALPYFVCACDMNTSLIKSYEGSQAWSRGLHNHLLTYFRRQCVLHVNEYASTQFEEDVDVEEALTLMNQLVLPALSLLSPTDHLDQTALEEVRDKWCHFLSLQLSDYKVEKLQDLLSCLFELPTDPKPMYNLDSIRFVDDPNLGVEYENLVKTAKMT